MCFLDAMKFLRRRLTKNVFNPHTVEFARVESNSEIFKLTDACFIKIFEWLSLQELNSVGQTCKHFQRLTDEYVRKNYPATLISYNCDGSQVYGRELNGIGRCTEHISIWGRDLEKFLIKRTKSPKSLKQIRLDSAHLPGHRIKWTKEILHQIEIFDLINCKIESTFYEHFLKLCVNLRRLRLKNVEFSTRTTHEWLQNEYPLLEYLEISLQKPSKIDELQQFFQQNPNIKRFSTNKSTLWKNMEIISSANIKLDKLIIENDSGADQNTETMCKFLNQLYEYGVYKALHLSGVFHKQETINAMASLRGLENLNVGVDSVNYDFTTLVNLKELNMLWLSNLVDVNQLAKCLVKLEKICLWKASLCDIIPFVRYSSRLHAIKIHNFMNNTVQCKTYSCCNSALNKERKKLIGACKVTIFIEENIILAAKWEQIKTKSKLVEIKRVESHEWGHHFLAY